MLGFGYLLLYAVAVFKVIVFYLAFFLPVRIHQGIIISNTHIRRLQSNNGNGIIVETSAYMDQGESQIQTTYPNTRHYTCS